MEPKVHMRRLNRLRERAKKLLERAEQLGEQARRLLREDRLEDAHRCLDEEGRCLLELNRCMRELDLKFLLWDLDTQMVSFRSDAQGTWPPSFHDPKRAAEITRRGLKTAREAIRAIKQGQYLDALLALRDVWKLDSEMGDLVMAPYARRSLSQIGRRRAAGSAPRPSIPKRQAEHLAEYDHVKDRHPGLSQDAIIRTALGNLARRSNGRKLYSPDYLRKLVAQVSKANL